MSVFNSAAAEAIRPDRFYEVSQWADEYRYLPAKSSSEPGKYRTSRMPYLREIMDALGPHTGIQEVCCMKATQLGLTELGNNWIMYCVDVCPAAMMAVFPTQDIAHYHSKNKLTPAFQDSPRVRDRLLGKGSRDSDNTILSKSFVGGASLWMSGSNSGANFRSRSVRCVFLDDIDGFETIPGEGDPLSLATRRTDSFGSRRKIYYNSTPTEKDNSWIEKIFNDSDQRYYHVPCPLCGHFQRLMWGGPDAPFGIKFARDENGKVVDVWYQCAECAGRIEEHKKTEMLEGGRWIATQPHAERRGYQISSLYSPVGWVGWRQIVREFLQAKDNVDLLRVWVNTRLGEPWEEKGEQPDWTAIMLRAEQYPMKVIPAAARLVTVGADVMDTFIAFTVYAWGYLEEAWLVDYGELFGDPAQQGIWEQLDEIILTKYEKEKGPAVPVAAAAVDTQGHYTQDVYNYCRRRYPLVMAVQGASKPDAALIRSPTKQDVTYAGEKIKGGVQLWTLGTGVAKQNIYAKLNLETPGPGYIHFPIGLPESFYMELTAEKRVTKMVKGYPRKEWMQVRPSNHVLDATVYAYAAAVRCGVHYMRSEQARAAGPRPAPAAPRQRRSGWIRTDGKRWV